MADEQPAQPGSAPSPEECQLLLGAAEDLVQVIAAYTVKVDGGRKVASQSGAAIIAASSDSLRAVTPTWDDVLERFGKRKDDGPEDALPQEWTLAEGGNALYAAWRHAAEALQVFFSGVSVLTYGVVLPEAAVDALASAAKGLRIAIEDPSRVVPEPAVKNGMVKGCVVPGESPGVAKPVDPEQGTAGPDWSYPETLGAAGDWLMTVSGLTTALLINGRVWASTEKVQREIGSPVWGGPGKQPYFRVADQLRALKRLAPPGFFDERPPESCQVNWKVRKKLMPPDWQPTWKEQATFRPKLQ